ncbi:MAG: hypothetical protein JNJ47_05580 [Alphaproteobacteria bacterium]|nr:hypothetical protein [Alphaproteobacteria bacterium]
MNQNSHNLLFSEESWTLPAEYNSCWNAKGLYNVLQFAVRLRPDIHRTLSRSPTGAIQASGVSDEQISAFSTCLHENIHWWQHIGSSTGLLLSLLYPAEAHQNHKHLKKILEEIGPIKSIREYYLKNPSLAEGKTTLGKNINIVLNNYYDMEFYRSLIVEPQKARILSRDKFFETVGHSYHIAISAIIELIASTIDKDLAILPDARKWEERERKLREERVEGFYFGSPIGIPPIGAKEIFEGQARFSQLQYLYFSFQKNLKWKDFESMGMLSDVYVSAFNLFCKLTDLEKPNEFEDSTVGLFLLVCDVATSPAECFTEDLVDFKNLIKVHDPGTRFCLLCHTIKKNKIHFINSIIHFTGEEYWRISNLLCDLTGLTSPYSLNQKIISWITKQCFDISKVN